MNFRKALKKDAEEIIKLQDLVRSLTYFNKIPVIHDEIINAPTVNIIEGKIESNNEFWYVAEIETELVGFVSAKKSGRIKAIFVIPEFQNHGIGTQLLNRAMEWLKNIKVIRLGVVKDNKKAIRFYKRLGFQISDKKIRQIEISGTILNRIEMIKYNK